jgi:hypothetical protein
MLTVISCAWAIPALGGPVVGGVLAGLGLWRTAFWAMTPIALLAAGLTSTILPRAERRDGRTARVPFGRLALICVSVLCIGSIANTESAGARAALLAAATGSVVLMLRLDRGAPTRLFPTGMLSLRSRIGKAFWMVFPARDVDDAGRRVRPLAGPGAPRCDAGRRRLSLRGPVALVDDRHAPERARIADALAYGHHAGTAADGIRVRRALSHDRAGPLPAIAASLMLVGLGIGTCWAHIGTAILSSARPEEGALTAAMIPSTQLFAVALGAALCGVIANAAGLAAGASRPTAALAGGWLFGSFVAAPLAAFVIASRLRPAR